MMIAHVISLNIRRMNIKDEQDEMPLDYKFFIDDYWVDVWGSKNVTNKIKQVFSDVLPFAATPCLMVVTATAAWDVRIRRLSPRRCPISR